MQEQLIEVFKSVGQVVGFRCVASFRVRVEVRRPELTSLRFVISGLSLTERQGNRAAMVSANSQVRFVFY